MKNPEHSLSDDIHPGSTAGAYGFTAIEVRAILAAVVIAALLFGARGLRDHSETMVPQWITQEVEIVPVASYAADLETHPSGTNTDFNTLAADERININTATRDDLMRLPGIGPKLADRIIAYRIDAGTFQSLNDLKNVRGIGAKKAAAIGGSITFTSATLGADTP